ncbi:hypothetical protein O6H91_13G019500 [Diphasiastrum complanatum]|uniref:Uncharacterized protein n=1 Tax=Diphasiastrum complanatum TaxID=34168 RepID=A0ACC2BSK1_DIPCM|nr:hypothetical protein O6H91_13G019500 [Diphasiastrum complanatum]
MLHLSLCCNHSTSDLCLFRVGGKGYNIMGCQSAIDQVWKNVIILLDSARLLGSLLLLIVMTGLGRLVVIVLVSNAAAVTLKGQTGTLRSVMAPIIMFVIGLMYRQVGWLLSPAIAVLEEKWGAECLFTIAFLVKGKRRTSFLLMAILFSIRVLIDQLTAKIMHGSYASFIIGGLMLQAASIVLFLLECLTTTVLYFVCISYHEHSTSFGFQVDGYDLAGYTNPQN